MNPLTFEALSSANATRCEGAFHPIDSWTPTDWACALAGEVGEACNQVKKLRRLEDGKQLANTPTNAEDIINNIGDELADTIIYADLLAQRLNINLAQKVSQKFNFVSQRVKSGVRIFCDENPSPDVLPRCPVCESIDMRPWRNSDGVFRRCASCFYKEGDPVPSIEEKP